MGSDYGFSSRCPGSAALFVTPNDAPRTKPEAAVCATRIAHSHARVQAVFCLAGLELFKLGDEVGSKVSGFCALETEKPFLMEHQRLYPLLFAF